MKTETANNNAHAIPENYRFIERTTDSLDEATYINSQTNQANCVVLAAPIEGSGIALLTQAETAGFACETADPALGIIEAGSGKSNDFSYAYFILKELLSDAGIPPGAQYFLFMDATSNSGTMRFHGRFEETGCTGIRESIAHEICRQEGIVGDGFDGWFTDPCGLGAQNAPANLSEDPRFDAMFPDHPLSKAREFVRYVLDQMDSCTDLEG